MAGVARLPCGLPGSIVTVGFTTLTPVCGAPVQRSSIARLKRGIRSAKMSVRMDGDLYQGAPFAG